MPEPVNPEPVFVDPAGRRLRWIRAAMWALIALAVGYVVLAISAVLGGPSINAPLLPQPPAAIATPEKPAPVKKTSAPSPSASSAPETDAPSDDVTPSAEPSSAPSTVPEVASVSEPTPTPEPTPEPTPTPTPTSSAPGNSGTAPGHSDDETTPGQQNRTEPTTGPRAP
jgi:outer membrane biosynthesis protein TonB